MTATHPLPTFLVIGAQKAATRWLRSKLGQHPDVFTAGGEPSFFNSDQRYEEYGLDWYRTLFSDWSGERHIGESTPGYMIWRHDPARVAQRIEESLGHIPLFVMLRNPVDRSHSALIHHIERHRIRRGTTLIEHAESVDHASDPLCIVSGSWYGASLEPFLDRFGDRVSIHLQEHLADQAPDVYRTALQHLGVDQNFEPPGLAAIHHSNRARPVGSHETDAARAPVTSAERRALHALFEADIERLAALTGLDLSVWHPDNQPDVDAVANEPAILRRARAATSTLTGDDTSATPELLPALRAILEPVDNHLGLEPAAATLDRSVRILLDLASDRQGLDQPIETTAGMTTVRQVVETGIALMVAAADLDQASDIDDHAIRVARRQSAEIALAGPLDPDQSAVGRRIAEWRTADLSG